MRPVIIPSEKQAEFEELKKEYEELNETMKRLSQQISAIKPFPDKLCDQLIEHQNRQIAIMERIRALGKTS